MVDSSISKFFEKNRKERLDIIKKFAGLSDDEVKQIENSDGGITFDKADKMVENAIGTFSLPSVIAAASKAAKIAKIHGGFKAKADKSYSIGQIQVVDVDIKSATSAIKKSEKEILDLANSKSKTLSKIGKGAKQISCREIKTDSGKMLIVELLIDVGDAMGANITNTMCEAVAPLIEKITKGRVILRILSNYSTKRMAKASAVFDRLAVGGEDIVDNIILAYQFALNDEYRAVTHNKGVMNGIIAVANATGQDTRAIEAAAHAYAARSGKYTSLTEWKKDKNGNLIGKIELPISVGIIGGIINVHPLVRICTKILGVKSAQELASVMATTGLAQNFSALRALASEGIQSGHMKLHARNIAPAAGAKPEQIDKIVKKMVGESNISLNRAKELLSQL